MADFQYLITMRQVFEVESKSRITNLLLITLTSEKIGSINLENIEIKIESNIESINIMPETTDFYFIYTARVVLKRVKCDICKKL